MVEVGQTNNLEIIKEVDFGVYLNGEQYGEVLLPAKYVPKSWNQNDRIDVFLYYDSEDRLIATTQKPYAKVGEFAYLKVIANSSFGSFLDWGLLKDLLVPFGEQKHKMELGESYIVRVFIDERTQRIAASTNLNKYLDILPVEYEAGQEVELLICKQTDLGYKAIINSAHWGVLYENEVFKELIIGQKITGYIKKIRDDLKIDLTLYQPGYGKVDPLAHKILEKLNGAGGFLSISDKSSPEQIYSLFGESKKTFKKAVGALYKERLIELTDKGISLHAKL